MIVYIMFVNEGWFLNMIHLYKLKRNLQKIKLLLLLLLFFVLYLLWIRRQKKKLTGNLLFNYSSVDLV